MQRTGPLGHVQSLVIWLVISMAAYQQAASKIYLTDYSCHLLVQCWATMQHPLLPSSWLTASCPLSHYLWLTTSTTFDPTQQKILAGCSQTCHVTHVLCIQQLPPAFPRAWQWTARRATKMKPGLLDMISEIVTLGRGCYWCIATACGTMRAAINHQDKDMTMMNGKITQGWWHNTQSCNAPCVWCKH